jgi:hypothetical protein
MNKFCKQTLVALGVGIILLTWGLPVLVEVILR